MNPSPRSTKSLKHANVARPSKSIVMVELNWVGKNLGRYWGSHSRAVDQFNSPDYIPHSSLAGSNYLMIDGHVEYMSFAETLIRPDGTSGTPNDIRYTMWDSLGK